MNEINVYTDGSFMKKKNQVFCGYGIYFPNNEYKCISRKFKHEPITNNRAELYAILKSIILTNKVNSKRKEKITKLNIYSDSEYSVKTFNIWLNNWKKNKKKYLNKDLIDEIEDHISNSNFKINIEHIYAHTGGDDIHSKCNDIADLLAKNGAFQN